MYLVDSWRVARLLTTSSVAGSRRKEVGGLTCLVGWWFRDHVPNHIWHGSKAGNTSGLARVNAPRASTPGPRLPHWGLSGCRPLDPSHPALANFKDAEVEPGPERPGSIAGHTLAILARSESECIRNPRLRFGLVWPPGRVCRVLPKQPRAGTRPLSGPDKRWASPVLMKTWPWSVSRFPSVFLRESPVLEG